MSEPKRPRPPKRLTGAKLPEGDKLHRLEGGLTDRQKDWCRQKLIEWTADALYEEALEDNGIRGYDDIFDLTQSDTFVKWQDVVLARPTEDHHPGDTLARLIVQLEKVDARISSMVGFLNLLKMQVAFAHENVKSVMNTIFHAYGGEVGVVTVKDKDEIRWQIYTAASKPDSVVLRRAKRAKKLIEKEKRKKKDLLKQRNQES